MGAGALSDDNVVKAFGRIIPVLADGGKLQKQAQKFKITGIPAMVFLDPEGNEIGRMKDRSSAGLIAQIDEAIAKHGRAPKFAESREKAIEDAKSADKPVAIYFAEESPKSEMAEKLFGELPLKDMYEPFVWVKEKLSVKSDEAKKIGLSTLPALWVIDPRADDPYAKPLKKIGLPKAGAGLKGELAPILKAWKPADKKPEGKTPEDGEKKDGGMEGDK